MGLLLSVQPGRRTGFFFETLGIDSTAFLQRAGWKLSLILFMQNLQKAESWVNVMILFMQNLHKAESWVDEMIIFMHKMHKAELDGGTDSLQNSTGLELWVNFLPGETELQAELGACGVLSL